MDYLNWELSVLSQAVAYGNLSTASSHVRISQPQLSRIIRKLEAQFKVELLERESKRHSKWTRSAYELVEIYSKALRQFRGDVQGLSQGALMTRLRIATLEGLSPLALSLCHKLFQTPELKLIEVTVEDLNEMEAQFSKGELDLIFTIREPGRKKFKYVKRLGYQTLRKVETSKSVQVMSTFEFGTRATEKLDSATRALVSNSLAIRKAWISQYGGTGTLPSEVRMNRGSPLKENDVPVLLVGSEGLSEEYWKRVEAS